MQQLAECVPRSKHSISPSFELRSVIYLMEVGFDIEVMRLDGDECQNVITIDVDFCPGSMPGEVSSIHGGLLQGATQTRGILNMAQRPETGERVDEWLTPNPANLVRQVRSDAAGISIKGGQQSSGQIPGITERLSILTSHAGSGVRMEDAGQYPLGEKWR
ncbi:hypothetical protein DM872_25035 [Pseudomonas taiwanensis]|uniref:hypothetical protein n=1 Tax=Pseudomonas taiwanensis TaxID=470150 RepID=UPI0015C0EA3E|nr:hypothetical protein [Pseudomonas taiwanensis]NWL80121.1 hypothetical protein [Pseudomonas taiwanensis]